MATKAKIKKPKGFKQQKPPGAQNGRIITDLKVQKHMRQRRAALNNG
jgi:hypothetical protein